MKSNEGLERGLRLAGVIVAVTCMAAPGGCDSSSDLPRAAPAGTLSGTIRYQGAMTAPGRPLAIALYRTFPPSGPPMATRLVERYELPYHYEFTGLAPGTYYVGALIDVDRMDTRYAGMLTKRDPYGYAGGGEAIRLDASQGAAAIDVDLEDPAE